MTWPAYSEYKSAGVEWLDQLPAGWEMQKLRRICPLTTGWTPPSGDEASYRGENLWANISDLGPRVLEAPERRISDEAVMRARIPVSPKGSLLFSFKLSIGQVSFAGQDMYTNEAIATFRKSPRLDLGFAYYSFPYALVKNASENIYGAKLLNQELMYAARIPLPPLDEQRGIAEFLDRETAKIDALIGKQEQLIATLREDRTATITHSVTKGLDPNVEMKDSTVEWLGAVPAHWTVSRFSRHIAINAGQVDPRLEPYRDMILIAPNHVEAGTGRLVSTETAADQGADSGKYQVTAGQVIYSKIRPNLSKVVIAPTDCLCSADMYGLAADPDQLSTDFMLYMLLSQPFTDYVIDSSMRVAMPKVNHDSLGAAPVWIPPKDEQVEIARYVEARCARIDALIAKSTEMIETLREYRSALITDAVTGKIDVRKAV
ncbi:type I restriction enzyme S subunit [Rhodococcus rhodochrous J45]|uniref:Type I restriction enzyme S subunit n=1 Tax=Rhodococcus rhodochrous J45 TaxID=935266 RepID=A0A562EMH4_RHORH|nr:restriction endonuclease subunit S [Rhodococcus rhodochrous]TWH23286.1 type I restriction enzyme S subunit [Rhodococcus rhodochrous J45]